MKVQKRSYGRPIGSHLGKPIYETITTDEQKFEYVRLATCDSDGCPLYQLETNEVMFNPGLIYKRIFIS